MALAIGFAVPANSSASPPSLAEITPNFGRWQTAAGILLAAGLIGVQIYWASPFRTVRQDYQRSVYQAAETLKEGHARTLVTIGEGPYPEHGVGWEAGIYTAYFSESLVVGGLFDPASGVDPGAVATDVRKLDPDAVLVWGSAAD